MAKTNPVQLQKYLKGLDYPAKKAEVVAQARRNGGDEEVVGTLGRLPDEEYKSPADVSKAGEIE